MKIQSFSDSLHVIGVSGGVDSVVLLHALVSQPKKLVVAHFDHGMRPDSAADAQFVKELAESYGLVFETARMELGGNASEATARLHRYAFLNEVKQKHGATALITAHHQDDRIETAMLNMLRGTKRRGFVSLQSSSEIVRPLIETTKEEILAYAIKNSISWREDSTNKDSKYLRNRVRKLMKSSLTAEKRRQILAQLDEIEQHNNDIDELVDLILQEQSVNEINKKVLNSMNLAESYEVAAAWLRNHNINFDEQTIKRLVIGARTLQNSSKIDLKDNHYSVVKRDKVVIRRRSSV